MRINTVIVGTVALALASVASAANVETSREAVSIRMNCAWTKGAPKAQCESYAVPEGKRLVVERMVVDAFLTPSADISMKFSGAEDPATAQPVVMQKYAGRHILYGRHIVAEGGTKLNINYRPAEEFRQIPASGTTTIRLNGYLEPAL